MKLKVQIPEEFCKKLETPVGLFNGWQYRTQHIELNPDSLAIDLADLPVFWSQFLEEHEPLRNSIQASFLYALKHVASDHNTVSYKKAMETLEG